MKRMYVTLLAMGLLVLWAFSCLGQKKVATPEEIRAEIHRRMMSKLLHGTGPDQDMFSDMEKLMDEAMTQSLSGFDVSQNQNFQTEWLEDKEGRTLTITPKSTDQNLDINVNNGMITIKGKTETKSQLGTSVSNFSNAFNVPGDCDEKKVKIDQKEGKILVKFPYLEAIKTISAPRKDERKPLPPSKEDIQI